MNGAFRQPWLNASMPRPNFTHFSTFSVSDALRVIQHNLQCSVISTHQINSIGQLNLSFHDADTIDAPGDQPIRL
jgi:hypothetical protein